LGPYAAGSDSFQSRLGRVIGGWQWRVADRRCALRCGHSSRGASGLGVAFAGVLFRRVDSRRRPAITDQQSGKSARGAPCWASFSPCSNGGSKARRMTALPNRKWTVRSHIEEMEKLIVLAASRCRAPGSDCRRRAGSPDGPHRRSWSGVHAPRDPPREPPRESCSPRWFLHSSVRKTLIGGDL
jgi:hypothetical protein